MGCSMIILFDEFEKVYDDDRQGKILTLLDGTYTSKKLFVVTCNDRYRVNQFMFNRPGRFFYSFKFKGLDTRFVQEYCEDRLNNKDLIGSVVRFSNISSNLNFDMLKAIVEEMNRYKETLTQVLKFINVESEADGYATYKVQKFVSKKGESILDDKVNNGGAVRIMSGFSIAIQDKNKPAEPSADNDDDDVFNRIYFSINDVVKYDNSGMTVVAENDDAYIEISKVVVEQRTMYDLL